MNEVKVGAPEVISGSQNSNVNLSVQVMGRCKELTLEEGATAEGSIVTAVRLLEQFRKEMEATESEGLGDSIEIQCSDSYKDDAVNGTSTQLSLGANGLTVPSSSVFWVINDVKKITEDCEVSVSPDGVVSVTNGGYVSCAVKAIDKNDSSKFVVKNVAINITAEHPELAEVIAEWPQVVEVIAEWPQVVEVIAEWPQVAEVIAEWPQVVNSLVETGKRNWLVGDGASYINLDFAVKQGDNISIIFQMTQVVNDCIAIFGSGSSWNSADAFSLGCYQLSGNNYVAGSYDIGRNRLSTPLNTPLKYEANVSIITLTNLANGNVTSASTNRTYLADNTINAKLFRAVCGSQNLETPRPWKISCLVRDSIAESNKNIVPFVHNGKPCMIDLVTCQIYENAGTGTFTIEVTDK